MTDAGHVARGEVLDIRDREAVNAFWSGLHDNGGATHLVNSAGGQFPSPAIDFSQKGWDA